MDVTLGGAMSRLEPYHLRSVDKLTKTLEKHPNGAEPIRVLATADRRLVHRHAHRLVPDPGRRGVGHLRAGVTPWDRSTRDESPLPTMCG